jgi:hypothetical protein
MQHDLGALMENELPLWEPLIRLFDHRDGSADYSLILDLGILAGGTMEVLVVLSETELTISTALDKDKATVADQVIDMSSGVYQILESEGDYRLTQSINHLDEEWDLFDDFSGQIEALAGAALKING